MYCTDTDITDRLGSLTDSQIDTAAKRTEKLRLPAKAWVDSVYPGTGPFAVVPVNGATGWLVNQSGHASGANTVTIDGGSGDPAAGDIMRLEGHNATYKVAGYTSNVVTFVQVFNVNPGVEDLNTATGGAVAAFLDNTPINFGTPNLIREGATWYAINVAYQVLRNNPLDEAALAALDRAEHLLGVGEGGTARKAPVPWYEDARDGDIGTRFSPMYVKLRR